MPVALLLEDEPLILIDLEAALVDAGFDVVPLMTCSDALTWLDQNSPDVAIVDIILLDGPSNAVVERLIEAKIPFIVHSGDLPDVHKDTPFASGSWVSKPAQYDELVRVAGELLFTS